jgi:hypothetical protein
MLQNSAAKQSSIHLLKKYLILNSTAFFLATWIVNAVKKSEKFSGLQL